MTLSMSWPMLMMSLQIYKLTQGLLGTRWSNMLILFKVSLQDLIWEINNCPMFGWAEW